MRREKNNGSPHPTNRTTYITGTAYTKSGTEKGAISFRDILQNQQELTISKHAAERMQERNIQLSNQEWQSIQEKVKEAKQKGVKDALVVIDGNAMVVSVKNNTVITALNQSEADKKYLPILMEQFYCKKAGPFMGSLLPRNDRSGQMKIKRGNNHVTFNVRRYFRNEKFTNKIRCYR